MTWVGECMWKMKHTVSVALLSLVILLAAGALVGLSLKSSRTSLFEKLVISPIPESVHGIKIDQRYSFWRRLTSSGELSTYLLRFDISRGDLDRVIAFRSLTEWPSVEYTFGGVYYRLPNGKKKDIHLYWSRQRPRWFDLHEWKSFTAYYAGDEGGAKSWRRVRLLLYNERLGRAYFVKHDITGL